jgi:thiol-disulfide isomerase/thioredoxin
MIKYLTLSAIALVAIGSVSLASRRQEPAPPVAIGKAVPDITVTGLNGKPVKLSSLKGKPVFLDFWATWCGPCRMSLPHTQELAAKNGKKISVLAISNETKDTITPFLKDNKYTFPAYRDADNSAGLKYKVEAIPTFVVIDKNGKLVDYIVGYDPDHVKAALKKVGIN